MSESWSGEVLAVPGLTCNGRSSGPRSHPINIHILFGKKTKETHSGGHECLPRILKAIFYSVLRVLERSKQ